MYRQLSLAVKPSSSMLRLLGIFLSSGVTLTASAASSYDYEGALKEASVNSPALQKMEATRDEMKWKGLEGEAAFLPEFSVNGSHYFEKRYQLLTVPFNGNIVSFPQIFPSSALSLDAKWLIFDGFANVQKYKGAQLMKTAGESDYQWAKFQLEEDVKLAYDRVVAAKQLLSVSDENLKTLQNHLDQVKTLKGGGIATNYDVLRVESELSEAQANFLQAQDNIVIAQERLGQVLGSSEAVDTTTGDLDLPTPDKVRPLEFRKTKTNRADLEALQERVYASDLQDSATNRYWVPKISIGGDYTMYNNLTDGVTDWKQYQAAWSAGFFLTWDIFNPTLITKSKQENYKAIEMQKQLVQTNLTAPVDFAFWKKRYLYNSTLYVAKKVDLERATETVRLSQAGFKAGVRTTTDVIDAELDLFRARAGVVNSLIDCAEAKSKLELSLGEKL
jgi:outer membrane protein TolC